MTTRIYGYVIGGSGIVLLMLTYMGWFDGKRTIEGADAFVEMSRIGVGILLVGCLDVLVIETEVRWHRKAVKVD